MDLATVPEPAAPVVSVSGWRRPVLTPLSVLSEAATGESTFLVETQAGSFLYAPLPS